MSDEELKLSWPDKEVMKYATFSKYSMAPVTLTGSRYQDDLDFPDFWNQVGIILIEWDAQDARVNTTIEAVKSDG